MRILTLIIIAFFSLSCAEDSSKDSAENTNVDDSGKKDTAKDDTGKDDTGKDDTSKDDTGKDDVPYSDDDENHGGGGDIEKQTMDAAKQANKKMEIDDLNARSNQGDAIQLDTMYGSITWDEGNPGESSFWGIDQDGESVEIDYNDIAGVDDSEGRGDEILKNLQAESVVMEKFGRRFTVKEVRLWMKTLEENRYKKTYNSDCRRVAWLVNHIGEDIQTMPKSMAKKWSKAAYGRERYLAKEFLKSQKQTMAEHRLRKLIKKVIISEVKQIRGINEKKKKL